MIWTPIFFFSSSLFSDIWHNSGTVRLVQSRKKKTGSWGPEIWQVLQSHPERTAATFCILDRWLSILSDSQPYIFFEDEEPLSRFMNGITFLVNHRTVCFDVFWSTLGPVCLDSTPTTSYLEFLIKQFGCRVRLQTIKPNKIQQVLDLVYHQKAQVFILCLSGFHGHFSQDLFPVALTRAGSHSSYRYGAERHHRSWELGWHFAYTEFNFLDPVVVPRICDFLMLLNHRIRAQVENSVRTCKN